MRVGLYGFGQINQLAASEILKRGWEISGVVDIREDLVGKDIGLILGLGEEAGVEVSSDPLELVDSDVVLHATGSFLDKVYGQLMNVVRMGVDVVSTCETLSYPYYRYPVLARRLDEAAKQYGVTVVGTGINPGYLLDTLPILLTLPFNRIKRISARRSLDASKRRTSFKKKIGVGMEPEKYIDLLGKNILTGHVGYAESVLLIADAAGLHLSRVDEGQEPVIAEKDMDIGDLHVSAGRVIGIRGYGSGYIDGEEVIRVEFHAYLGAEEYEEIVVEGEDYTVKWRSTGTPGDKGTVAVLLNIASMMPGLEPGLLLMTDIFPVRPVFKR